MTSRRRFLQGSTTLVAATIAGTMQALHVRQARAWSGSAGWVDSPYGPIAPVRDLDTGLPLLQLPQGFAYRSYGWTGDPMMDGQACPSHHDGMAVVASSDGADLDLVLVRNHERGAAPAIAAAGMYDSAAARRTLAGGGATTLRFRERRWVGMEASLGGTVFNCAGGPTPWGTWLSCEETLIDLSPQGGRKHGYVFEVRAQSGETTGRPIVTMGRFMHEAVAVDPATGDAYLTEDSRNKAGLYRFRPADTSGRPGSYEAGGRLQMARVVGRRNGDLTAPSRGDTHRIEWVDIADPDADPVDIALPDFDGPTTVSGPFAQGWAAGGLRMSRGEGIWHRDGKLFIVDTSAGVNLMRARGHGRGAVWEYDLARGTLKALFVSMSEESSNHPDNITLSPRGGIVLCEDGGGVDDRYGFGNRLVGLTRDARSYVLAKNHIVLDAPQLARAGKRVAPGDYRSAEFCGACFDPLGGVLFVNIQSPGITFAIWGPWPRGNL